MRRLLSLALAVATLPGCATVSAMFGASNDNVDLHIAGTHAVCEVNILGVESGTKSVASGKDHIKLKLSRSEDYRVTVKSPGFEPAELMLKRNTNLFTWLDGLCILGGAAGGLSAGSQIGNAVPPLAALGSAAGCCVSGGVGCCITALGATIDISGNNHVTFDHDVTIMLKKARTGALGPELVFDVVDDAGHHASFAVPAR